MHKKDEEHHDPFYQQPSTGTEEQLNSKRVKLDDDNFWEETASEFSEPIEHEPTHVRDEENHVFGWVAVALSIISFFLLPIFFAIAGIIIGVFARNRDSAILGYSAIVLGILSLIMRLFVVPML